MNRRTLLRLIGGAAVPAALGLTAEQLLAAGRSLDARAVAPAGPIGPFSAQQRETVATLAEAILPATDTPGARAARVDEYIAMLLDEWYPAADKAAFMSGLAAFDARSTRELGGTFVTLPHAKQAKLLTELDAESRQKQPPGTPRSFFQWMKELTVSGFYSSRVGSEQFLHTVIWPGRYDGCRTIGARPQGARS